MNMFKLTSRLVGGFRDMFKCIRKFGTLCMRAVTIH